MHGRAEKGEIMLGKVRRGLARYSAAALAAAAALTLVIGTAGTASALTRGQPLRIIGSKVVNGKTYPVIHVSGASPTRTHANPASASSSTIVNQHSGKCAEVFHSSTSNGANVDQWSCNRTATQSWHLDLAYFDQYGNPVGEIINNNSGKCFEVYNWAAANGSNVDQWGCAPIAQQHANQLWDVNGELLEAVGASNERGLLVVAEVAGWSTANGGNVDIWQYLGDSNQHWTQSL
jgi:hypothetical protein